MEKITITIPDNLNHGQEILAIAKELGQKMIPQGNNNQLQLGTGYTIRELDTQITIKRESVEKPIVTLTCSVCETVYEKSLGKKLWVNYGGKTVRRIYCKDECRDVVIDMTGEGRASIKKTGLKPFRLFN